jgi:hypothetical protein
MNRAMAETWRLLLDSWDSAYAFTHDQDPDNSEPFSAERRDDSSVVLRAKDPEALRSRVLRNYLERKVPREVAP